MGEQSGESKEEDVMREGLGSRIHADNATGKLYDTIRYIYVRSKSEDMASVI